MTDEERTEQLQTIFERIYWELYRGNDEGAAQFASHLVVAREQFIAFARLLTDPDALTPDEQFKTVFRMVARGSWHLSRAAALVEAPGDATER